MFLFGALARCRIPCRHVRSHHQQYCWINASCAPPKRPTTFLPSRSAATSVEEGFSAVALSLKKAWGHLQPWSVGDLAFGLSAVSDLQEGLHDAITGPAVKDVHRLTQLCHEVAIADAVYKQDARAMCARCTIRPAKVRIWHNDAGHFRPAYCIAVREEQRQIVLVVRGTGQLSDALTNLAGATTEFQGGQAHEGMLRAASWLLDREASVLQDLLQQHSGFSLRFIGHSLGAGTATLAAMLLKEEAQGMNSKLQGVDISVCAVAAPAVVSRELAVGCCDFVTSIVCRHDVVARASLKALEALRDEVAGIHWERRLRDKVTAHRLGKLAEETGSSISSQYQRVSQAVQAAVHSAQLQQHTASVQRLWDRLSDSTTKHAQTARQALQTHLNKLDLPFIDHASKIDELQREALPEAQKAGKGLAPLAQLYAPGRLLYIRQTGADSSKYEVLEAADPSQRFERILLNRAMFHDHLCTTYLARLQDIIAGLSPPNS